MSIENERLTLKVLDDGIGIKQSLPHPRRALYTDKFGLFDLRRRMRQLGGELTFAKGLPRGTCAQIVLPFQAFIWSQLP